MLSGLHFNAHVSTALTTPTAQHIHQGVDPADYSEHGFPTGIATQETDRAHRHSGFTPHFHIKTGFLVTRVSNVSLNASFL